MNISDIPMTAPSLVPVPRNVFRADLLEAAYYFLSTPDALAGFELLVGDTMMARPAVAHNINALALERRLAGDLDPAERFEAQLQYARDVVAEGTMTPGRKLKMLDEVLNSPVPCELVRVPEPPAAAVVVVQATFSNDYEASLLNLLGDALQALQHMTLGQLRAHRINPLLLENIERAVNAE